jgi:uncharacterized membrane protein (DUF2068 family)
MDWNLYRCSRAGHITYAPDEPAIAEHSRARTAGGDLWQCVRCGTYVAGPVQGSGPVAQAPVVRRGKEIRSEIILRVFAIERFLRFLVFAGLAYGVFRFDRSQQNLQQAFNNELPIFRSLFHQLGYNIDRSGIVGLFRSVLHISHTRLHELVAGLAAFAVVELVEGIGLWLAKRWGEYFAAVVTAIGLPYEIYDLTAKVTATRVILFLINLALVLYLILTKRLFGARGGERAYEARLRGESIFDAIAQAEPGQPPARTGSTSDEADGLAGGGPGAEAAQGRGDTGGQAGDASSTGDQDSMGDQVVPAIPVTSVAPAEPTLRMTPRDTEPQVARE